MLHCWESRNDWWQEHGEEDKYYALAGLTWMDDGAVPNATCMREAGHEGPHEWTQDSDITITFNDAPPDAPGGGE